MSRRAEVQQRKPGRSGSSGHHRGSTPSLSSNRSFKKSGNGQADRSQLNPANPGAVQNVVHHPAPPYGFSEPPAPFGAKPVNTSTGNSRVLPKPPPSQSAPGASDPVAPKTPPRAGASKGFPLQFGTISPGIVNVMQIPARTSSAPPNLDEQKRDQARHNTFRAVPTQLIPAAQKQQQQQTRKDVGVNQSNAGGSHPLTQTKRDAHLPIPSSPTVTQPKPSVLPIGGMPMSIPFQHSQVPLQFGGPSMQMQSQGVAPSSLQMTMGLQVGNASQIPQQMFIPGIHSHSLQTQAMMHQGQGLNFAPQMGHQLVSQSSSLGIGIPSQFSQQQHGKFGTPRKTTVKITHPDTHEELRLDKRIDSYVENCSTGQMPLPNVTSQSQPIPAYAPTHPINYYSQVQPNSYTAPSIFFPTTSLPMTSTQMATGLQGQRYSYTVSQGGQVISFMNHPVLNSMPSSKPGTLRSLHGGSEAGDLEGLPVSTISVPVPLTVKASLGSYAEKVGAPSVTISEPISKVELPVAGNTYARKPVSSVTISAPVSKALPSVTVSRHISKAEASVVGGMPVNKAELSEAITVPAIDVEAPKSLKPSGDITASELQRVMDPVSSAQQPKPASEPSNDVTEHASGGSVSAVVSMLSAQRTQPVTSTSAPITSFTDSGSVVVTADGRKREPVQRSESLKEHREKPCGKDSSHPLQDQTEASVHAGCMKSSSTRLIENNSVPAIHIQQVSDSSEKICASMVADSSVPTGSSLPPNIEHSLSGTSEGVKGQVPNIVSGLFGVMVEKEASENFPSVCSTAYSLEKDGDFPEHSGPSEISSSLNSEPDGNTSTCSKSFLYLDEALSISTGEEQKIWESKTHGKDETPNDLSLNTNIVNVGPVARVAVNLAKVENTSLEKSETATACELNDEEKQKHDTSDEAVGISLETDKEPNELSTATSLESVHAGSASSSDLTSGNAGEDKPSFTDTLSAKVEICSQDVLSTDLVISPKELAGQLSSNSYKSKVAEPSNGDPVSVNTSESKYKPSREPTRVKTIGGRKKKRKEILSKADAAGASDLYNAYKGPEGKQEVANTSESTESTLTDEAKHVPLDVHDEDSVAVDEHGPDKSELDDWEDAAEISTPKLRTSENAHQIQHVAKDLDEHGNDATGKKKYSRDFLLTFQLHCIDLPIGFGIGSDIADALISAQVVSSHESYPSPGRITDRSPSASRGDRRMGGMLDNGKWIQSPGSFGPGGDVRGDIGNVAAIMNLRPGQGGRHGVLKNPRGQPSGQFVGGIFAGPVQPSALQGGAAWNNSDADRWQHSTGFQRGFVPSPHTPLQVMHKAERKYEVGKVSDEEEAKQRQLKAILNKLTPQNFEKLFAQVKEVNIDNAVTLTGVISQIFDKALTEPTFCEMYANFCSHLAGALPDFSADNEKITFKRLLLNKCQEEFERGEREQAEADKVEEEGEIKQSEQEREQKRLHARRRMLGNIRLIGELYKKKMLTERIMHSCITKLLGQHQNPEEEDIEALCKLMSTIGEMIDQTKAKVHIDAYFSHMQKLSTNQKLSSRVRFLLRDAIDLRKNNWRQRRKVDGPKTIEEVHRDAAQERQAQSSRLGRGPVNNSSGRRGQSIDYGPRGSAILASPNSQHISSVRNNPGRNFTQDVRLADRNQFDSRSVPLPQRPIDSDSITLGPQGGLARGMSIRGQLPISNVLPSETHSSTGDPRRIPSSSNGHSSISNRSPYSSREETTHRSIPDRSTSDHVFDRIATTPFPAVRPSSGSHNMPSEAKTLSEEGLREKSITTVREFYSARDVDEVALCIRELSSPSYHASMVSLWVMDSFERKDMERDLLAGLLVNLSKSHSSLLSQMQLIEGFEFVLSSLEDAVNDAPKAAEFLGRILGKVVVENVVSLGQIGKLVYEGGEAPGNLIEIGLASEVLGSVLEFIRTEKGDSFSNEIRASSNLRLEDFRPPHPLKSKKLDEFL